MAKIKEIKAREIVDSRGIPTIQGRLTLTTGRSVRAAASSGESLGKFEGVELRDGDPNRFHGQGVLKAISYINELITPRLIGVDIKKHVDVDYWLKQIDGTPHQSKLGVNTVMTISQLVLKAAAKDAGLPLYRYANQVYTKLFNKQTSLEKMPGGIFSMINGGKHGSKNLEFQEFHILPTTSISFRGALEMAGQVYATLHDVLKYRNAELTRSVEGGFAPNLLTNTDALEIVRETLSQARLKLGIDIYMGLDIAAAHFYKNGKYVIRDKSQPVKSKDYLEFLIELNRNYDVLFLEDPLDQEDFESWKALNEKIGKKTYITGDDFLAGQPDKIKKAAQENACSAVLVKFNQTGTVTELMQIISLARDVGLKVVFSHRLGETNDSIIADLAVGLQADFVKFGPPVGGERVAKYNRLVEIEDEIKRK